MSSKLAYKYHCACGWFKSTSESDAGLTNVFGSGLSFDPSSADRVQWRNVVWIVVPADALELLTEQGRHKVEYNVTSVSFFGGYFSIRIQFRRADHIIQNWRRNLVEIPWLFALISPWTKWPPFWQTTNSNAFFLEWKWYNSDLNFTEICSQESNWHQASIGSGDGLVPNRLTQFTDTYVALGWDELRPCKAPAWRNRPSEIHVDPGFWYSHVYDMEAVQNIPII